MTDAEVEPSGRRVARLSPEDVTDLLSEAPDLIRIVDDDATVMYASGASIELLGSPATEMEGRSVTDSRHPDDRDALMVALRQALATQRSVRRVHLARQRDGRYRWLETTVRALNTAHGRFALLISRAAPARPTATPQLPSVPPQRDSDNGDWQIPDGGDARRSLGLLTDRERQVVSGLAEGVSVKDLARRLRVRESTVRGHVKAILQKLQVHSQIQAVLVALRAEGAGEQVNTGASGVSDLVRDAVSRD